MTDSDTAWYEAFRTWENRCRGWRLWDFAVELEPPFSSIAPDRYLAPSIGDDARIGGGIRGLLSRNQVNINTRHQLQAHGQSNPFANPDVKPKPFYRASDVTELEVKLPRELDAAPAVCEQLLLSLGTFKGPVAFEIVADSSSISIQLACSPDFSAYLKSQWKAPFPAISIAERNGFLVGQFGSGQPMALADFGLAKNFTLPLRLFRSFNPDPLGGLFSSCSSLSDAERAVFQILFRPAGTRWSDELHKIQTNTEHQKLLQDYVPNFSALLRNKLSSPLFAVSIRVTSQAPNVQRAWEIVRQIGGNFRQYTDPSSNELIALSNDGYPENDHRLSILSRTNYRSGMLLNTSELASLVHLPSSSVRVEKLNRSNARTKALPASGFGHSLVLGANTHDSQTRPATLSHDQRTRHTHVIGSTGSGKSTLLLRAITQDIEAGEGVCVIDPHGDLIDAVCESIPENRIGDVVLFNPADSDYTIGFNILQAHTDLEKSLISSDMAAAFRRMSTSWGDVMDAVLANAVLAILESSRGGTLLDLKRFLVEKDFRSEFLQTVADESVRYFWLNEFPLIAGKPHASILIRLDTFLRQKLIRDIVCQKESKLNFREIMDHKKILLIKLSQGVIGVENSHLLGSLLITKLHQIAQSRQDTTNRPFFAVYIDEFHNVIVPSLEATLAGIRKQNIALTLSHQEWRQIQSRSLDVAASVMSNCYTRICFRLGDTDARLFGSGFSGFDASDLQNLGIGEAIARIGRADYDFNLKTQMPLPVDPETALQRKNAIIETSRRNYATPKVRSEDTGGDRIQVPTLDEHSRIISQPSIEPNELPIEEIETKSQQPNSTERKENYGRAGQHHQELQAVIKRVAETYGFQVTVEQGIEEGAGRVDVSLEKENLRIACEVSVTTTDYEITNILKCLASGYDHVIVVVSNQKKLPLINSKIQSEISIEHQDKVKAFGLPGLLGFLRNLGTSKEFTQTRPQKPAGQRLNFAEACEFFGVTGSTLYRWVREGRVPFYRPGREYQFDRDELVLIGKHDHSGKRKVSVKLTPLTIGNKAPKGKKEQDSRYRKLLKLD
ncbi:MAG: type IV secretion system DNA-binding domain-containing protein [Pyrinomonadaceae bacterium]